MTRKPSLSDRNATLNAHSPKGREIVSVSASDFADVGHAFQAIETDGWWDSLMISRSVSIALIAWALALTVSPSSAERALVPSLERSFDVCPQGAGIRIDERHKGFGHGARQLFHSGDRNRTFIIARIVMAGADGQHFEYGRCPAHRTQRADWALSSAKTQSRSDTSLRVAANARRMASRTATV